MKLKLNLAALVWEKPFAGAFGQKLFCKCVVFAICAVFSKPPKKKKPNTMWGYPKIAENQVFLHFHVFVLRKSSKNCGGAMGRLSQNSREKQVSQFLLILKIYPAVWKNNVFLNFCYFFFFQKIAAIFVVFCFGKSLKTIVALCGAMWRYVVLSRNLNTTIIFSMFATFAAFRKSPKTVVALGGASWCYVALS